MTETWASPSSSTAISSGLVRSVSSMYPCNDQFQIRNISTRELCTKPGIVHLKLCTCPVSFPSYICTLYIWCNKHRQPWSKKPEQRPQMVALLNQLVSPCWWQRVELHPHPPQLFRQGSSEKSGTIHLKLWIFPVFVLPYISTLCILCNRHTKPWSKNIDTEWQCHPHVPQLLRQASLSLFLGCFPIMTSCKSEVYRPESSVKKLKNSLKLYMGPVFAPSHICTLYIWCSKLRQPWSKKSENGH